MLELSVTCWLNACVAIGLHGLSLFIPRIEYNFIESVVILDDWTMCNFHSRNSIFIDFFEFGSVFGELEDCRLNLP